MIVACLGDSNTRFGQSPWPRPGPGSALCWPEYAAEMAPEHTWLNVGMGASTVCPFPTWEWSQPELAKALAHAGHVDIAIAAFGTNDIGVLHQSRDAIIQAYCDLIQFAGTGTRVIVATTPRRTDNADYQKAVEALNARIYALERKYPEWRVLDFDNGLHVDALVADGVHLTVLAQQERAHRAVALVRSLGA